MFRNISVVSNGSRADGGVLAHAGEWALRLRLPLRTLEWPGPAEPEFFRPFELCVFGKDLSAGVRDVLLCKLEAPHTSALICPPAVRPVRRVLVLNQHARPDDGFLDVAAEVCRAFEVTPVLLTVAHSEAEARSRERSAEEAFARRGLTIDCDFSAGCDVTTAVVRAARWRRCSHVFLEHRPVPRWRRWLGGDVVRELTAGPDSPTLLAVHAAADPSPAAKEAGESDGAVGAAGPTTHRP